MTTLRRATHSDQLERLAIAGPLPASQVLCHPGRAAVLVSTANIIVRSGPVALPTRATPVERAV